MPILSPGENQLTPCSNNKSVISSLHGSASHTWNSPQLRKTVDTATSLVIVDELKIVNQVTGFLCTEAD